MPGSLCNLLAISQGHDFNEVNRFGWHDALGRKGLRHTISGRSELFTVADDAGNVIIRPAKGNGVVPTWTHDALLNACSKLRRLITVKGEKDGQKVRFVRADCYENFHLSLFVSELINGTVAIDFDAGIKARKRGTP